MTEVMASLRRFHVLQLSQLASIPAVIAEVVETVDVTSETTRKAPPLVLTRRNLKELQQSKI